MALSKGPRLDKAGLGEGKEFSRFSIAVRILIVILLLTLVLGMATGNFQVFAFVLAIVGAMVASWMWGVAVDRLFHRYREWSKKQAPQPVVFGQAKTSLPTLQMPLKPVESGPGALVLSEMLKTSAIPLVYASAASKNAAERTAALKMQAAESLYRLARHLEDTGSSKEHQILWDTVARLDPLKRDLAGGTVADGDEIGRDALAEALTLVRSGKFEEAKPKLEQLKKKDPSGAVLYALAICYGAGGQADLAERAFMEAAEAGGESAELRLALGVALAEQGEYKKAIKQLKASVTMKPGLAAANAALGDLLVTAGELESARDFLEDALAGDKENTVARIGMGRLLYVKGDPLGASREFNRALDSDKENPQLIYNIAACLAAAGRLDEAVNRLEPLAKESDDPEMIRLVAEALQRSGKPERAQEYLARSADMGPVGDAAKIQLAASLREQGKLDEALAEITNAEKDAPNAPDVLMEKGRILEAMGSVDKAITALRAAAAANRSLPMPATLAGRLLIKQGQAKDALTLLKQAVTLPGAGAETRYWLGEAFLKTGKALLAIDVLQQAAMETGKARDDINYALGRAYLDAGRPKEAAEEFRRAKKLADEVPELNRDLGYALHKQRNYREAEKYFRLYLQAAPDAKDAREVKQLADSLAQ